MRRILFLPDVHQRRGNPNKVAVAVTFVEQRVLPNPAKITPQTFRWWHTNSCAKPARLRRQ
jgi:hypothetical protein